MMSKAHVVLPKRDKTRNPVHDRQQNAGENSPVKHQNMTEAAQLGASFAAKTGVMNSAKVGAADSEKTDATSNSTSSSESSPTADTSLSALHKSSFSLTIGVPCKTSPNASRKALARTESEMSPSTIARMSAGASTKAAGSTFSKASLDTPPGTQSRADSLGWIYSALKKEGMRRSAIDRNNALNSGVYQQADLMQANNLKERLVAAHGEEMSKMNELDGMMLLQMSSADHFGLEMAQRLANLCNLAERASGTRFGDAAKILLTLWENGDHLPSISFKRLLAQYTNEDANLAISYLLWVTCNVDLSELSPHTGLCKFAQIAADWRMNPFIFANTEEAECGELFAQEMVKMLAVAEKASNKKMLMPAFLKEVFGRKVAVLLRDYARLDQLDYWRRWAELKFLSYKAPGQLSLVVDAIVQGMANHIYPLDWETLSDWCAWQPEAERYLQELRETYTKNNTVQLKVEEVLIPIQQKCHALTGCNRLRQEKVIKRAQDLAELERTFGQEVLALLEDDNCNRAQFSARLKRLSELAGQAQIWSCTQVQSGRQFWSSAQAVINRLRETEEFDSCRRVRFLERDPAIAPYLERLIDNAPLANLKRSSPIYERKVNRLRQLASDQHLLENFVNRQRLRGNMRDHAVRDADACDVGLRDEDMYSAWLHDAILR